MKKLTVRRSWMRRGKGCRYSSRRLRSSRTWIRCFGRAERKCKRYWQEIEQNIKGCRSARFAVPRTPVHVMGKVRDEMNEIEARFLELAEKSSICRTAAEDFEG